MADGAFGRTKLLFCLHHFYSSIIWRVTSNERCQWGCEHVPICKKWETMLSWATSFIHTMAQLCSFLMNSFTEQKAARALNNCTSQVSRREQCNKYMLYYSRHLTISCAEWALVRDGFCHVAPQKQEHVNYCTLFLYSAIFTQKCCSKDQMNLESAFIQRGITQCIHIKSSYIRHGLPVLFMLVSSSFHAIMGQWCSDVYKSKYVVLVVAKHGISYDPHSFMCSQLTC